MIKIDFADHIELDIRPLTKQELKQRYIRTVRSPVIWDNLKLIKKLSVMSISNDFKKLKSLRSVWTGKGVAWFRNDTLTFAEVLDKHAESKKKYAISDFIVVRVMAVKRGKDIVVLDGNHRITNIIKYEIPHLVIIDLVESKPGFALENSMTTI